jgi:hypothetical protein
MDSSEIVNEDMIEMVNVKTYVKFNAVKGYKNVAKPSLLDGLNVMSFVKCDNLSSTLFSLVRPFC